MHRGVSLFALVDRFGPEAVHVFDSDIDELADVGLLESKGNNLRLTPRGRLLSNEVFTRFVRERNPARA
jgi:oxygen-independent coproporphyrinogen-3 oxidase